MNAAPRHRSTTRPFSRMIECWAAINAPRKHRGFQHVELHDPDSKRSPYLIINKQFKKPRVESKCFNAQVMYSAAWCRPGLASDAAGSGRLPLAFPGRSPR